MQYRTVLLICAVWLGLCALADGRTWTDSTGAYRLEANLIGFDASTVVLKKDNGQLVAFPIAKLSKEDRTYLESKDTVEQVRRSADAVQTWTMASEFKVVGRIVDYARKDITIQQRRGKTYVNDRVFGNLPEVYQKMLPKLVSHFEKTPIEDKRGFDTWVMKLRGQPRTFTCEGVMLELDNGDEYGVPFFFFSNDDQKILQPGWQRWLAADKDRAKREQESMLLQTQAQAYQQDRKVDQQISMMQLQMQGYEAGLYDLWEVALTPGPGVASPPLSVVVPARDSRTAVAEALRRNPGFVAGPVRKVRREYGERRIR
jgi:hypothetical protein